MANSSAPRDLKPLSELRYQVAEGEPDVRGWPVYASTGHEVGTVADLLVDPEAAEVVMLDVDLRGNDQHTLAPIRAAWVDQSTRRVVIDASALDTADADTAGTATADVASSPAAGEPFPALPRRGPLTDADIQRFDAAYVRAYGNRAADQDTAWRVARGTDDALRFTPQPPERRGSRLDDASELPDEQGIDPRELDARVRIDEGATAIDAPVAGVRYDGEEHTPHDYGTPNEAYGPGHGSGRIGFNKIVSREPYTPSEPGTPSEQSRSVRYRQYDDRYAGPDAPR